MILRQFLHSEGNQEQAGRLDPHPGHDQALAPPAVAQRAGHAQRAASNGGSSPPSCLDWERRWSIRP